MATTTSTNETLDKVTTDEANADAAASQATHAPDAPKAESEQVQNEQTVAAKTMPQSKADAEADSAAEEVEALKRADNSVVADDLAKDSASVDVSAFMTATPQNEEPEQLDAVTGQVHSTPRDEQNLEAKKPITSSVESDLAAEEAALAAEALVAPTTPDANPDAAKEDSKEGEKQDEEKAPEVDSASAPEINQDERLAKAKKEIEAAQEERRTKVAKALEARPDRIKPEPEPEEEEEEEPLTLLGHLGELRVRVVRCFIAIGLAFMLCYSFSERIFNELMVPLVSAMPPDSKLIFTALPEAFFVYMQVALVAAIFVASPYIFYQVWAFISPGLYEEEKKTAIPIAFFSASFFIGGAAFCYFQVFPYAFQFFMGFATDLILPMPSLSEYLSFALKMLFAFGLIFEMPLFAFFLSRIGLVTADMMRKVRKYAILCMFIVAAILTPPDVFSQCLMAAPMLVLYEISILIAAAVGKKKKEEAEADEKDAEGNADKPNAEDNRPMQGD